MLNSRISLRVFFVFVASHLLISCGQSRVFHASYDDVWAAAESSFGANVRDPEAGKLAYVPPDAPFGNDGFGVIHKAVEITPVDDGETTAHKVRVYIRGQDIINPFSFLHGYPELEVELLDKIAAALQQRSSSAQRQ